MRSNIKSVCKFNFRFRGGGEGGRGGGGGGGCQGLVRPRRRTWHRSELISFTILYQDWNHVRVSNSW